VPVGKVIALLAEEGDDISNLEAPKEEPAVASPSHPPRTPSPSPSPEPSPVTPPELPVSAPHISHSRPLFPSVHRLMREYNITAPQDIKGTGVRGMLTKGDILTYLGKTSGPSGTYKEFPASQAELKKKEAKSEPKVRDFYSRGRILFDANMQSLDGPAIRRLIVSTMFQNSLAARAAQRKRIVFHPGLPIDTLPISSGNGSNFRFSYRRLSTQGQGVRNRCLCIFFHGEKT